MALQEPAPTVLIRLHLVHVCRRLTVYAQLIWNKQNSFVSENCFVSVSFQLCGQFKAKRKRRRPKPLCLSDARNNKMAKLKNCIIYKIYVACYGSFRPTFVTIN